MEQIKNYFHLEIDTQSLSYERFITHLKFLSRKLFASERMDDMNDDVQEMIQKICPEEYQCAGYIKTFIKERYKKRYDISRSCIFNDAYREDQKKQYRKRRRRCLIH